jgi:hypothetical protein
VVTKPNSRQVGGDHYNGTDYQHWDFANEIKMLYLPGVASKYVARWRDKGGVEDLEKCVHYLEKCEEVSVNPLPAVNRHTAFWRFMIGNDVNLHDAAIIWFIMEGQWEEARQATLMLIASQDREPLEAS